MGIIVADKRCFSLILPILKFKLMRFFRFIALLALLLMAGGVKLQAQIRIDKQQCFGGYDEDLIEGRGIIMEDDFILLAGYTYKPGVGTGAGARILQRCVCLQSCLDCENSTTIMNSSTVGAMIWVSKTS
jgi:hypothetical protein